MFDFHEVVGAQGVARADQIDNRVAQANQRTEFHRAVEFNQIHIHAFGGEMRFGSFDVFGDHAQARALLDRRFVIKTILHRDRHAAFGNA